MKKNSKALTRFLVLMFAFMLTFASGVCVSAANETAIDITAASSVQAEGFYNPGIVLDGDYRDYTNAYNGAVITAKNADGIGYIYLIFETPAKEYTVTDTEKGETRTFGNCGMIHELLDLKEAFGYLPAEIRIDLNFHIAVSEIFLFSEGTLPGWVQRWEEPLTESDMLLLISHSDDDQLFFAGLLPLYAGERGLKVQVAYFTNHDDVANRRHELLDGLWHTGVRNYPIIAEFPDLYSESLEGALDAYKSYAGYTADDFNRYVYELIQETRPLVVVTHDLEGEYGHGTHILCANAAVDAINKCTVPDRYGDIDGKWHVAKFYLHLYEKNRLTLDIDKQLSSFDGKTAFNVSQEAFGYHISQHWTWFYGWLYGKNGMEITLSTQITEHSPREYGLYSSAVGMDTEHSDMFENLETIGERAERLEAESKAASESIAAEESAKAAESERLENERIESERIESERISESIAVSIAEALSPASTAAASTSEAAQTASRFPSDNSETDNKAALIAIASAAVLCACVLLVIHFRRNNGDNYV